MTEITLSVRGCSAIEVASDSRRDLVVAGGRTRPIAGHFRVKHRAWSSVDTVTGPLLLARTTWAAAGSVVALLRDRDAASARLLGVAAQIAAATDYTLAVICPP